MAGEPALQRGLERASSGGMRQVLRVKCQPGKTRATLQEPPTPGARQRTAGAKSRTGAPPNRRGSEPNAGRMEPDRCLVFAEEEFCRRHSPMTLFSCEPGRRDEPYRWQAEVGESSDTAIDSLSRGTLIEGEKLAFSCGPSPRTQCIARGAWETDFIMTLSVQHDLRTLAGAIAEPVDECGMSSERPVTVPIGNHQEGRNHSMPGAHAPQLPDGRGKSRRHVVNRDQKRHAPATSR